MSVYLITLFLFLGGLGLALVGLFIGIKWGTTQQQVLNAADHESYKARLIQERALRRALNLELQHLRQENQKYMNLFVNLPEAVKRLHAYQTIPEAIAAIVRLTKDVLNPNQITFFLYNQETSMLELRSGYNLPFQTPTDYGVVLGEGPIGLTAAQKMLMTRKDFELTSLPAESSHRWLDSYMCAPIVYEEKLIGVLSIGQVQEETGREQTLLAMIADIAAIDLQNATARQSIEKEAITDPLTGLFNRRYFFHRLPDEFKRAKNYQFPCSVFLFDLDDFKHYNDTNGHPAGDQLLQTLSRLVEKNTRKSDIMARYGGEEFIVLLINTEKASAIIYAEKIRRLIETSIFTHGEKQPLGKITISGGIACFPEDGATVEKLIRAVDHALYQAKKAGKNKVLPYSK